MRTIKRYSLRVNQNKWQQLCEIAKLFRDEKNYHLHYFNKDYNFYSVPDERIRRDVLVQEKYKPATRLQARHWKMALTEAHDTVDKNWCALAAQIKPMISQHTKIWSEAGLHYAYWLIVSGKRLAELVDGEAPVPDHFAVSYHEQKQVRNFLRRVVRRKRGLRPVAHLSRSFILDANMYSVIEKNDPERNIVQFIKIMGLIPRKQVVVPLTGYSNFSGTIRIVLDFTKHRIEVHTTKKVNTPENPSEGVVALDAGITEVFTDERGQAYEPTFGITLTTVSNQLNKTGKARNKSYVLRKISSKYKAHRIFRYNLGKKKVKKRKNNGKIRIEQQISQAIHRVVKERKPAVMVTERLNIRGKSKSKGMSRLVSYWMRGSLKERLEVLALAEGFCHKQVNPAYTSQMCPSCLFVHKDNRKGDIFHCLNCGHTDYTDRVAAINLLARYDDPDITIYTPKSVVKAILQGRFIASLERIAISAQEAVGETTVSGRTDTYANVVSERNPVTQSYIDNEDGTRMSDFSSF